MEQNNFYQLKLGLPGTSESEVLQGQYGKLILPAAAHDYMDAIVTYVESWTIIHLQLPDAYLLISELQKQLQQTYQYTKSLSNPISGSAGIMKYGLQNEYYRILIIKRIDPTLILVRFVDFGFTDVVTNQLIHWIPENLTHLPAQAFPIQMELKHSIAGSMSLDAFRKYLTNAQVIVQLGDQIMNDSFTGIIYVINEKNKWYWMDEAIELRMSIKRLMVNGNGNANDYVMLHSDNNINHSTNTMIKLSGKTEGMGNLNDSEMIDQSNSNGDQLSNDEKQGHENRRKNSRNSNYTFKKGYLEDDSMPANYHKSNSINNKYFDTLQQTTSHQLQYTSNFTDSKTSDNSSMYIIILITLVSVAAVILLIVFCRKRKLILSKWKDKKDKKASTDSRKTSHSDSSLKISTLDRTTTSEMAESSFWKNSSRKDSGIKDDELVAEDLSSVIGLMAYGSLKDDIDHNVKKNDKDDKPSRQQAGRSVIDFDKPSTCMSNIKNTREISRSILKNRDNTMGSSLSKKKIRIFSENFDSESSEDDDNDNDNDHYDDGDDDNDQSDSSVSSSVTSLHDISDSEENARMENCLRKNNQKKETVVEIATSSDNESLSEVSSSSNLSSTKTDSTSEAAKENTIVNDVTSKCDSKSIANRNDNISLTRKLSHAWVRSDNVLNDNSINDSHDSIQQNSTLQSNDLQPNSTQTFPVHDKPSLSFIQTIDNSPNKNTEQNKYSYANSIHSSDFEIPSYLNTVPKSSYSYPSTYHASDEWIRSQLINDTDRWFALESERTNSTQIHSKSPTNKNRIQSEMIRSRRNLSASKFPQKTENIDKFLSKSFRKIDENAQNSSSNQSRKYTSISSTIPLTNQLSAISEAFRRYTTDAESSSLPISHRSIQKNETIDLSTNSQQSIEYCQRKDVQFIDSKLSKISSLSTELNEIPSYLSLGRMLNLSDTVEMQKKQSNSTEDGLTMKLNMTSMPKQYISSDQYIKIDEHYRIDRETNRSRSISSLHSTTTTTTYESTQDLSIIRS